MSINSALLAGVSGLIANSASLSSISENIANVNTVGYKRVETDFQDVVTASALSDSYNAGGVNSVTRQLVSQQGDSTQTNSPTDLFIAGQGFFVATPQATNNGPSDPRDFTRAGSFTPDKSGYLENTAGLYLQGWLADQNGVITTDPSDLNKLSSINVSSFGGTASATSAISVNANLNSNTPVVPVTTGSGPSGAYAAGDMASYEVSGGTSGVKPDYSFQIPVSDSLGGQRTVEMDFEKSSTPNVWNAEVRVVPPTDVAGVTDGMISSGLVAFTSDGKLDTNPVNTTLPTSLTLGASLATTGTRWASTLGVSAQTISLDLGQAPGGLTQAASKNVVQSITTNGTSFGNLSGITIDKSGFVTAAYDNGITRQIAQVALATFPNPDGLKSVSGDAYQVALDSGTFNLKTPGSGGAGTLSASTLEASTVDLSSEFTGLIVTQRAYSASSKIITTADQMLQELISIKQ